MKNISGLSVVAILVLSAIFTGACGKMDDSINDERNNTENETEIADKTDVKILNGNEENIQNRGEANAETVVKKYLQALGKNISSPEEFENNTGKYIKNGSDAYRDMKKYVGNLNEFKISGFVIKSPRTTVMLHNIISENSDYSIKECENSDKKAIVTVVGTTPDFESEKNRSMAGSRIITLFMNYIAKSGEGTKLFTANDDDKNKAINKFINENSENIKSLFADVAADAEKVSVTKTITLKFDDKWLIENITNSYNR